MSNNITSDKFNNTYLKDLLKEISLFFKKKDIIFYIIGATARDIIIKQLLDKDSTRHTQDLDIAISIPNWDIYEEISNDLSNLKNFEKSKNQKQRFIYKEIYEIDIVPFDGVAKEDLNIYWPPEEDIAMSVIGFKEILDNVIKIKVDNEFDIYIASLSGIFLLKLNAWKYRHISTSKDAVDIYFIIDNYYDAYYEKYTDKDFHPEIYNDFDPFIAGATWLGYDIVSMLPKKIIQSYYNILKQEIEKKETSTLIEQMMEQNHIGTYETIFKALNKIALILHGTLSK